MRYLGVREREIVPEIFYGDGGTWAVNLFSGPRPLGGPWRESDLELACESGVFSFLFQVPLVGRDHAVLRQRLLSIEWGVLLAFKRLVFLYLRECKKRKKSNDLLPRQPMHKKRQSRPDSVAQPASVVQGACRTG